MGYATVWLYGFGALFAGYLMLAGIDYGVAIVAPFVARTDGERRLAFNAVGPFFLSNEVWLVVAFGMLAGTAPRFAAQASGRLDSVTVAVVVLAVLSTMEITTPMIAAGEQTGAALGALRRVRRVLAVAVIGAGQATRGSTRGARRIGGEARGVVLSCAGVAAGVGCLAVLLSYRLIASHGHIFWSGAIITGALTFSVSIMVGWGAWHFFQPLAVARRAARAGD